MNTAILAGIRPPQPRGPCYARVTPAHGARIVWMLIVAALAASAGRVHADEGATLAALEIAYGREMNAHADALAYAAEAQREGHCEAACLFRASAAAESIHAARIAAAIEQLDARPAWTPAGAVVQGTADNLKACLERKLVERDRIYPRFAALAREECLYDAGAVFQYAREGIGTEVVMFEAVLGHLEREVTPTGIALASTQGIDRVTPEACAGTYYLCPGDGSLFSGPIAGLCQNCGTGGSHALALSCISGGRAGSAGVLASQVAVR
jgi:rubrerythrin